MQYLLAFIVAFIATLCVMYLIPHLATKKSATKKPAGSPRQTEATIGKPPKAQALRALTPDEQSLLVGLVTVIKRVESELMIIPATLRNWNQRRKRKIDVKQRRAALRRRVVGVAPDSIPELVVQFLVSGP